MGIRASRFKVQARLTLLGDGAVDAIRLSRPGSGGCCGGGRRSVASFTFRRGAEGGAAPLVSAKAASIKMDKLAVLDQETPIRVQCLAQKKSVFCQELPLRDLLAGLKYTTVGSGAVMCFTLSGGLGVCEGQGQGCPVLFCNGKRVGSRPEAPQQTQAVLVPEAGQEVGPTPQAGQVAVASPGQGAEPAPGAGQLAEASLGPENSPVSEAGQVALASPGQGGAGPAPGAGQLAEASPSQEHSPASEAGLTAEASPGQDGLGVWKPVPSTEGHAEEAESAVTPAEDERSALVLRRAGKGVAASSPPPQRKSGQPGEARQGEGRPGGRVSRCQVWDALLSVAQAFTLSLVAFAVLEEFFPG